MFLRKTDEDVAKIILKMCLMQNGSRYGEDNTDKDVGNNRMMKMWLRQD